MLGGMVRLMVVTLAAMARAQTFCGVTFVRTLSPHLMVPRGEVCLALLIMLY